LRFATGDRQKRVATRLAGDFFAGRFPLTDGADALALSGANAVQADLVQHRFHEPHSVHRAASQTLSTLFTTTRHVCATRFVMAERDDLDATVSVRFPSKVRARLEELADADDRRVSQVVRRIVTRAIERGDDGGGLAA
jgi:hypothetical protein